jgi:hypothetical protein
VQTQSKKQITDRDPFSGDVYIVRWSNLLSILVVLAALLTIALVVNFALHSGKIGLMHDEKIHVFFVTNLSWPEFCVAVGCVFSAEITWMYGLLQLFWLARHFRRGRIFDEDNSKRLLHISYVLAAVTVIDALTPPIIAFTLYWRGVTPWLSDLPLLRLIEPAYILASIFFFILAKVMSRAVELERESRLYV